jgi:hypothetical protein
MYGLVIDLHCWRTFTMLRMKIFEHINRPVNVDRRTICTLWFLGKRCTVIRMPGKWYPRVIHCIGKYGCNGLSVIRFAHKPASKRIVYDIGTRMKTRSKEWENAQRIFTRDFELVRAIRV